MTPRFRFLYLIVFLLLSNKHNFIAIAIAIAIVKSSGPILLKMYRCPVSGFRFRDLCHVWMAVVISQWALSCNIVVVCKLLYVLSLTWCIRHFIIIRHLKIVVWNLYRTEYSGYKWYPGQCLSVKYPSWIVQC